MSTVNTESSQNHAERRWIRLQEIGLVQLLAIPVVIIVIALIKGFTITGPTAAFTTNLIILTAFFLSTSGFICLKIGHEKRVELTDKEDSDAHNTQNEQ